MDIENLNLFLGKIKEGYSNKEITKEGIEELIILLESIIELSNRKRSVDIVVNETNRYVNNHIKEGKYEYEISVVLINLSQNITSIDSINKKDINKVYER